MHVGADIMSGRRTKNAAHAKPRIARLTSRILRVRRGGADGDALWFMLPLETEGRFGGVCNFGYVRDTRNPRFRQFLRLHYRADYVVVDAKNHCSAVTKINVLQLANTYPVMAPACSA
jgi:hypothetical protein